MISMLHVRSLSALSAAMVLAPAVCSTQAVTVLRAIDTPRTDTGLNSAIAESSILKGFRLSKRLAIGGTADYVMLFSRGKEVRLVVWTLNSQKQSDLWIPVSPGLFRFLDNTGKETGSTRIREGPLHFAVRHTPQFILPRAPNDLLRVAAAWERAPAQLVKDGPRLAVLPLTLANPLGRKITARSGSRRIVLKPGEFGVIPKLIDLRRSQEPIPIRHDWEIEGLGKLSQRSLLVTRNPLRMTFLPAQADSDPGTSDILPVLVQNPASDPFSGFIELTDVSGIPPSKLRVALDFKPGQKEILVGFPGAAVGGSYRAGARIRDTEGKTMSSIAPRELRRFSPGGVSRGITENLPYYIDLGGDGGELGLNTLNFKRSPGPTAYTPELAVSLKYRLEPESKSMRVIPRESRVDNRPRALGIWMHGDGKGVNARIRFVDSSGQNFMSAGELITWMDWRFVMFSLNGTGCSHSGGANDGIIHYPIRFGSILELESVSQARVSGEILFAAPTLIY